MFLPWVDGSWPSRPMYYGPDIIHQKKNIHKFIIHYIYSSGNLGMIQWSVIFFLMTTKMTHKTHKKVFSIHFHITIHHLCQAQCHCHSPCWWSDDAQCSATALLSYGPRLIAQSETCAFAGSWTCTKRKKSKIYTTRKKGKVFQHCCTHLCIGGNRFAYSL